MHHMCISSLPKGVLSSKGQVCSIPAMRFVSQGSVRGA